MPAFSDFFKERLTDHANLDTGPERCRSSGATNKPSIANLVVADRLADGDVVVLTLRCHTRRRTVEITGLDRLDE
jgi:hypothetical protein